MSAFVRPYSAPAHLADGEEPSGLAARAGQLRRLANPPPLAYELAEALLAGNEPSGLSLANLAESSWSPGRRPAGLALVPQGRYRDSTAIGSGDPMGVSSKQRTRSGWRASSRRAATTIAALGMLLGVCPVARAEGPGLDLHNVSSGVVAGVVVSDVLYGLVFVVPSIVSAGVNGASVAEGHASPYAARVIGHVAGWGSLAIGSLYIWGGHSAGSGLEASVLGIGITGVVAGATAASLAIVGAVLPDEGTSSPVSVVSVPLPGGGMVGLAGSF